MPAPNLYLETIAIGLEMAASFVLCTDETTREREGFTDPELGRSLC